MSCREPPLATLFVGKEEEIRKEPWKNAILLKVLGGGLVLECFELVLHFLWVSSLKKAKATFVILCLLGKLGDWGTGGFPMTSAG